jgi:hypothetical protein
MYYDTRPSVFNGVFDFYTYEKLKGYYPFYWYGLFYDCKKEIPSQNSIENIYSLCGVDNEGKTITLLTYYSDDDMKENKKISVDFGKCGKYEIRRVDSECNGEVTEITDKLTFDMELFSIILIREK